MAKNVLIAQSGGPTAAINASLAGVIARCLESGEAGEIYGALNGMDGILARRIIDLRAQTRGGADLERLSASPAMALGSCRRKLPELGAEPDSIPAVYEKIESVFREFHIGFFFYIGGNDSMDTAKKVDAYFRRKASDIRVIGVPKTIDNDLPVTDHTPGYGSAAKYVAATMLEIGRDCSIYDIPSVTIVEIMGRGAGWLAAAAAVPRYLGEPMPQLVYLPEAPFETGRFLADIRREMGKRKGVVAAVSEGVRTSDLSAGGREETDAFGHAQLAGVACRLEQLVRGQIGCKTRAIQLNIMQRCAFHLASQTDVDEARLIGRKAAEAAFAGKTGRCMCFRRTPGEVYGVEVEDCDLGIVANREKKFPAQWINDAGNGIREEGVRYILPLIRGRAEYSENDYLPDYFRFDRERLVAP